MKKDVSTKRNNYSKSCFKNLQELQRFLVSPNIYHSTQSKSPSRLLPENSTQYTPARTTSLLPREKNRDILTEFFGHTEHFRHCREKAVLAAAGNTLPRRRPRRGATSAPRPSATPSAVGFRPALPGQAGGRLTLGCRFYTPYLWLYK